MSERDFVFWLNGFIELNGGAMPTELQWKMIQDHLKLVFHKVTPTYPETTPYIPWPTTTPFASPYEITCSSKPQPTEPMRYCSQLDCGQLNIPIVDGVTDMQKYLVELGHPRTC